MGSPGSGSRDERRRDRREQRRPRPDQRPTPVAEPPRTQNRTADADQAQPGAADLAESADRTGAAYTDRPATEYTDYQDSDDAPALSPAVAAEPEQRGEPAEPLEPVETFEPLEPVESLERVEPVERVERVEPVEPVERAESLEPVEPRYSRLGADGLRRLRARYADVRARLEAATVEDAQRPELEARARRLDPDGWATADEVAAALEEYESVFESLRAVVGRHRRRKR
jgi:hypothetical protein